jgi:hypothetical protein
MKPIEAATKLGDMIRPHRFGVLVHALAADRAAVAWGDPKAGPRHARFILGGVSQAELNAIADDICGTPAF